MDSFLRDAEHILETAAAAVEANTPQYAICVSRTGAIRILSEIAGWSLPALALELGAAALYQVSRHGATIRVEGWSYGRKCLVTTESAQTRGPEARPVCTYATLQLLEGGGASQNDRGPHVRNS